MTALFQTTALAGLFLLQAVLGTYLKNHPPRPVSLPAEQIRVWSPEVFKTVTFGHWPAAVDWLWIKVLANPDVSRVTKGARASIHHDLELAADLDPAFLDLYLSGANLLAIVRDDGASARDLLLKGDAFRKKDLPTYSPDFRTRHWANEWSLPLLLGYVYLFELNDIRGASTHFVEAAALPGAPAYLASLSRRFEKPGGEFEVGLRLLNFMIAGANDHRVKERLEAQRLSLALAQYLFHHNRLFKEYLNARRDYHVELSPSRDRMQRYWERFLKESGTTHQDPFGGSLKLSKEGRVYSTTPHQPVFGLE